MVGFFIIIIVVVIVAILLIFAGFLPTLFLVLIGAGVFALVMFILKKLFGDR